MRPASSGVQATSAAGRSAGATRAISASRSAARRAGSAGSPAGRRRDPVPAGDHVERGLPHLGGHRIDLGPAFDHPPLAQVAQVLGVRVVVGQLEPPHHDEPWQGGLERADHVGEGGEGVDESLAAGTATPPSRRTTRGPRRGRPRTGRRRADGGARRSRRPRSRSARRDRRHGRGGRDLERVPGRRAGARAAHGGPDAKQVAVEQALDPAAARAVEHLRTRRRSRSPVPGPTRRRTDRRRRRSRPLGSRCTRSSHGRRAPRWRRRRYRRRSAASRTPRGRSTRSRRSRRRCTRRARSRGSRRRCSSPPRRTRRRSTAPRRTDRGTGTSPRSTKPTPRRRTTTAPRARRRSRWPTRTRPGGCRRCCTATRGAPTRPAPRRTRGRGPRRRPPGSSGSRRARASRSLARWVRRWAAASTMPENVGGQVGVGVIVIWQAASTTASAATAAMDGRRRWVIEDLLGSRHRSAPT